MIEAMTEELNIPILSGGSTTFKKELQQKGLEPDECYWVATEHAMRGRTDIDFEVDPPPDIAVEVEISRSVLNRLGIYAALRVAELWRSDGHWISIVQLQEDGTYAPVEQSPSFPWLPLAELGRFLRESSTTDETSWIRSFRAWVRAELAPLVADAEDRQR
jgi:Uma2 family endonuclease